MRSKSTGADPRSVKIERYQKEKKLKEQMSQYEKENPDGSNDEEAERAYWLNFIQFAETDSSGQLEMLKREAEMLKLRDRGVKPEPPRQPPQSSQVCFYTGERIASASERTITFAHMIT